MKKTGTVSKAKNEEATKTNTQAINVYVRIRPLNQAETKRRSYECVEIVNHKEIHVKQSFSEKSYSFEHVFGPKSVQTDIFKLTAEPLIQDVLKGYNCTIFAYGQTGSGKTHTIVGQVNDEAGIIPRSVDKIFEAVGQITDSSIRISFLELYNEELFDLFSTDTDPKNIKLFEDKDKKNSVLIHGLEEVTVNFKNEVYQLLEKGYAKQRTAATLMNANSSRSHTVFTITVHMREVSVEGEDVIKIGKLNLVDLAGSENIQKSGSVAERAREASNINQSLLTLGRVITALTEKNAHVPYRESKLTRILQDSLGGRAKTSLIATISPAHINVEETITTLEYAVRVRSIQNRPEVNVEFSRSAMISLYQQRIKKLKNELKRCHKSGTFFVDPDNYNQLLKETEDFNNELQLKNEYVEKLNEQLSEAEENLTKVQSNWSEVSNKVETLMSQKRALEENLISINEQREKHAAELKSIREKHRKLKNTAKELISTAKLHSKNEDILHQKVNFLYTTSQRNVTTLKNFRDLFDDITRKIIDDVDFFCVHQDINRLAKINGDFARKLDETYAKLKANVDELLRMERRLDEFKIDRPIVTERVRAYFKEFEKIAGDAFSDIEAALAKFNSTLANDAQEIIGDVIATGNDSREFVLQSLENLRSSIHESNQRMSALFPTAKEKVDEKFEKMEKCRRRFENICAKHEKLENNATKKRNENISHVLNLIENFDKKYSSCYAEIRQECNALTEITNKLSTILKAVHHESASTIKNAIIDPYTQENESRLRKLSELIEEHKRPDAIASKCSQELIDTVKMMKEENNIQTATVLGQLKDRLNTVGKEALARENFCKNLKYKINESSTSLIETISSVSERADAVCEVTQDVIENAEICLKDGFAEVNAACASYEKFQQNMSANVEEFCHRKLSVVSDEEHVPMLLKKNSEVLNILKNC